MAHKRGLYILLGLLVVAVGSYGSSIGYYSERFLPNTTINGLEVSALSLGDVNTHLEEQLKGKVIQITEADSIVGEFTLGELEPVVNIGGIAELIYNSQDPTLWVANLFNGDDYTIDLSNQISINREALYNKIDEVINNQNRMESKSAGIEYSEADGYYVRDEVYGNQVDVSGLTDAVYQGLKDGNYTFSVRDFYNQPYLVKDSEEIVGLMAKIDEVINTPATLIISGQEVEITKDQIESWVYFDGANNIQLDRLAIQGWLDELDTQYATVGQPVEFNSTNKGIVQVVGGTYGWVIDSINEADAIARSIESATPYKEDIAYLGVGYNGVPNTYIEVDLSAQEMYVYIDGNLEISTPIVSGRVGTETIPGAYVVWGKESPSNLKGYNPHTQQDYVQPVTYWMPFDATGQGIHDANWQPSFGGDAYISSGSLGCINTPPGTMAQVYNLVPVQTPVFIH